MLTLKKSLGQHFLKDDAVCLRIVEALQAHLFKQLLEVGPGGGALTKYLVKIPFIDFKLIEIDQEKIDYLLSAYPSLRTKILSGSILEIELPFQRPFTMIGNFPYNISTQIVFKVIEWREHIETMVGMFQKEVAQRICAQPGSKDYGVISVIAQAYFHTNYLFDVDPSAFNPPPNVTSGVIRLTYKGNVFEISNHHKFKNLVKAAFSQRRKQLRNPLKPYFEKAFLSEQIFSKRAEQLSIANFVYLLNHMK